MVEPIGDGIEKESLPMIHVKKHLIYLLLVGAFSCSLIRSLEFRRVYWLICLLIRLNANVGAG
ncbi:MAG: hypothetical protein C0417_04405 [Chlorobiaceae bacterium]|nr:hypothetical protein [Chlorobiaceae bacterium]